MTPPSARHSSSLISNSPKAFELWSFTLCIAREVHQFRSRRGSRGTIHGGEQACCIDSDMTEWNDIVEYCGGLALRGPLVNAIAQEHISLLPRGILVKPSGELHITLLTKEELHSLGGQEISSLLNKDVQVVVPLGVGGRKLKQDDVFYVATAWAGGAGLRKRLQLPPRHFYISLTSTDPQDFDHRPTSVFSRLRDPVIDTADERQLDCLFTHYLSVDTTHTLARDAALALVYHHPSSSRAWARLAICCAKMDKHKLAMLAFARVLVLVNEAWHASKERIHDSALTQLLRTAQHTEWGMLASEEERLQISALAGRTNQLFPGSASPFLGNIHRSWPPFLVNDVLDSYGGESFSLAIPSQKHLLFPDGSDLPRAFRWIVPFRLAVSSMPRRAEDVIHLRKLGISLVITLTEENALRALWFQGLKGIRNVRIPIKNYDVPTIGQVDAILELVLAEPGAILVHCSAGKGRAGTVVAIYLALFSYRLPPRGSPTPPPKPVMEAPSAIALLRRMRPGSLETKEQELFVSTYIMLAWERFNESSSP